MHIVSNNTTCGGGSGITKMTFREMKGPFVANIDDVQQVLDTMSFTIEANEGLFLYIPHFANSVDGVLSASKFLVKNIGPSNEYSPDNPLSKYDMIHVFTLVNFDVLEMDGVQIMPLGDLTDLTQQGFADAVNGSEDKFTVQASKIGERIFTAKDSLGVTHYCLFTGEAGLYGADWNQTNENQFIPFGQSSGLQSILAYGNRGIKYIQGNDVYDFVPEDKTKTVVDYVVDGSRIAVLTKGTFNLGDTIEYVPYNGGSSLNHSVQIYAGEKTVFMGGNRGFSDQTGVLLIPFGFKLVAQLVISQPDYEDAYDIWQTSLVSITPTPFVEKGYMVINQPYTLNQGGLFFVGGLYEVTEYAPGDDFTNVFGIAAPVPGDRYLAMAEVADVWANGSMVDFTGNPIMTKYSGSLPVEYSTHRIGKGIYMLKAEIGNWKQVQMKFDETVENKTAPSYNDGGVNEMVFYNMDPRNDVSDENSGTYYEITMYI